MVDRLFANWPLKLLALGLAFAIWVSVTGENRILQDLQVPLDLRIDPGLVLSAPAPTTVAVRLRGPESQMRRLDPVPLALRVDLTDAHPGDQDLPLASDQLVGVPRGVEIVFVIPDRLRVTLDRRMRRDLPVEPTFLGRPARGHTFYGAQITPEVLSVEGPQSQVADLEVLRTSPIRLDGRTAPFVARVGVVLDRPLVHVSDPRPLEVRVLVDELAVERSFDRIPVRVVGAVGATSVAPAAVDVTVSGPPQIVNALRPDQVLAIAEASGTSARREVQWVDVHVRFENIPPGDRARIYVKSLSRRRVAIRSVGDEGAP